MIRTFSLRICIVLAFAAAVCGQRNPFTAREQLEQERIREEIRLKEEQERQIQFQLFPYSTLPRQAPLPFHIGERGGLQRLFPFYEGVQTNPSAPSAGRGAPAAGSTPGFGGYPGATAPPGGLSTGPLALRKVPEAEDSWPSWIDGGGSKGMRATPEQAVLVRVSDRVWLRSPNEPAFEPLAFFDRFRFMSSGTQIEVRGQGEYQVILYAGGNLRSRGACALSVKNMDSKEVALELRDVSRMWVKAGLRPFRVVMPDATLLSFSRTLVYLERKGDRCHVSNLGGGTVRFAGTAGNGELRGPQSIRLWMKPASAVVHSRELNATGGVATTRNGAVTRIQGARGGQVAWSGALFRVGAGATLEIKPLSSN